MSGARYCALVTLRLKGRRREASRLIELLSAWAHAQPDVDSLLIVGSYARGAARMASDLDVMILTPEPAHLTRSPWFTQLQPGARWIRSDTWGPVSEQRYRLRSGFHVELNYATVAWAALPLDTGTERVLSDGHRIVTDRAGIAATAAAAVSRDRDALSRHRRRS